MGKIVGHVVRALVVDLPDLSDGELLSRYVADRDAEAFAALVRRHGPMVRGVCRRILRNDHDAEDAFQATFLVLVRKAKTIKPRAVVGNWLYGVAYHTAVRARAIAAKRRGREIDATQGPEPSVAADNREFADILPLLDRKLNALPDKYRAPIVLCDLEGRTRKEAAQQLGWPEGTVAGRLARGRAILARRLGKMIGVLSLALAAEASARVPLPLVEATLRAASMYAHMCAAGSAAAVISGPVAALTEGVVNAMIVAKLKTAAVVLALVVVVGAGTGGLLFRTQAADAQVGDDPRAPTNPAPISQLPNTPATPPQAPNALAPPQLPQAPPPDNAFSKPDDKRRGLFDIPPIQPPAPPTREQLRIQYLKLQEDLSRHLSAAQLKQRADELEKEVAAANALEQRLAREKSAAAELQKAKAILTTIATQYQGTPAATKAGEALRLINGEGVLALPPTGPPAPSAVLRPLPGGNASN
jgi:RNA polymerase sigma factor (sigma-70 family)